MEDDDDEGGEEGGRTPLISSATSGPAPVKAQPSEPSCEPSPAKRGRPGADDEVTAFSPPTRRTKPPLPSKKASAQHTRVGQPPVAMKSLPRSPAKTNKLNPTTTTGSAVAAASDGKASSEPNGKPVEDGEGSPVSPPLEEKETCWDPGRIDSWSWFGCDLDDDGDEETVAKPSKAGSRRQGRTRIPLNRDDDASSGASEPEGLWYSKPKLVGGGKDLTDGVAGDEGFEQVRILSDNKAEWLLTRMAEKLKASPKGSRIFSPEFEAKWTSRNWYLRRRVPTLIFSVAHNCSPDAFRTKLVRGLLLPTS